MGRYIILPQNTEKEFCFVSISKCAQFCKVDEKKHGNIYEKLALGLACNTLLCRLEVFRICGN